MALEHIIHVFFTVFILTLGVYSEQFEGCIGDYESDCCTPNRYELYAGDTLILRSGNYFHDSDWCDRQVIVRRNEVRDDDCSGCTLTVQFQSSTAGTTNLTPGSELILYEGNYTSASYYYPQNLLLTGLAAYSNSYPPPYRITTKGNLLKIVTKPDQDISVNLIITPNFSKTFGDSGLALTLGITAPVTILVALLFGCLKYHVRRRQARRLRDQVNSAIAAAAIRRGIADRRNRAVREAITTAVLQRLSDEDRRRSSPHSPDPTDSISPPAYSEAIPPPSYTDVVAESGTIASEPANLPLSEPANQTTTASASVDQTVVVSDTVHPVAERKQVSTAGSDIEGQVSGSDVELDDMAGPDTGHDVDRLVI